MLSKYTDNLTGFMVLKQCCNADIYIWHGGLIYQTHHNIEKLRSNGLGLLPLLLSFGNVAII